MMSLITTIRDIINVHNTDSIIVISITPQQIIKIKGIKIIKNKNVGLIEGLVKLFNFSQES
jgi:hypothetical protein